MTDVLVFARGQFFLPREPAPGGGIMASPFDLVDDVASPKMYRLDRWTVAGGRDVLVDGARWATAARAVTAASRVREARTGRFNGPVKDYVVTVRSRVPVVGEFAVAARTREDAESFAKRIAAEDPAFEGWDRLVVAGVVAPDRSTTRPPSHRYRPRA